MRRLQYYDSQIIGYVVIVKDNPPSTENLKSLEPLKKLLNLLIHILNVETL